MLSPSETGTTEVTAVHLHLNALGNTQRIRNMCKGVANAENATESVGLMPDFTSSHAFIFSEI